METHSLPHKIISDVFEKLSSSSSNSSGVLVATASIHLEEEEEGGGNSSNTNKELNDLKVVQQQGNHGNNDDVEDDVKSLKSLTTTGEDTGDDDTSTVNGDAITAGTTKTTTTKEEQIKIAKEEERAVLWIRCLLAIVLISVAVGVSTAVFVYTRNTEHEEFETKFQDHATKLTSDFRSYAARRLGAMEGFAASISANARAQGQTWPNVTVPDFQQQAEQVMKLAAVLSIALIPFVTNEQKEGWDAFSLNHQEWYYEGLEYQKSHPTANYNATEDAIYIVNAGGTVDEANVTFRPLYKLLPGGWHSFDVGPGPYFPWWQYAPLPPVWQVINYDSNSHPTRKPVLDRILETKKPVVTSAWDLSDTEDISSSVKRLMLNLFLNRLEESVVDYHAGPVSDLYLPIFGDNNDLRDPRNRTFVGVLTSYVYWQVYFENILPAEAQGIIAVLENTAGQMFTYRIDGSVAEYIGQGDLHEVKYNGFEVSTGFGAFSGSDITDEDNPLACVYNVRVYPSQEFEDTIMTSTPLVFTLIVVAVFGLTSLVFIMYDWFVEKRQKVVMKTAVQSTEVVQSLFPENVRQRLFEDPSKTDNASKKMIQDEFKSYSTDPTSDNTEAIADVYDDTTIFFADLVGFTAWSNGREPKQVFTLLETLYGAFDAIAKRRGVFKVETIGDCYLAIVGVPTPNKDHAVVCVKFASEALVAMNKIIHEKLIHTLGEDTAALQMRVGLHSGPVTAGVLRGDRARFQLFGDTVNTASRMESNSLPGKIHVTKETADLLIAAGKASWVTEREGGVEAKGKGRLRTFWVQTKGESTVTPSIRTASN